MVHDLKAPSDARARAEIHRRGLDPVREGDRIFHIVV
jgi:hypothetical protein